MDWGESENLIVLYTSSKILPRLIYWCQPWSVVGLTSPLIRHMIWGPFWVNTMKASLFSSKALLLSSCCPLPPCSGPSQHLCGLYCCSKSPQLLSRRCPDWWKKRVARRSYCIYKTIFRCHQWNKSVQCLQKTTFAVCSATIWHWVTERKDRAFWKDLLGLLYAAQPQILFCINSNWL